MKSRTLNKALIALLAASAVGLAGSRLRMPHSTEAWMLAQSAAAARAGETMPVHMLDGTVDVNAASAEELNALYGVGPSLAEKIIAEREKNGAFHYPEDLISVNGIGEKTLEKMRDQLKLP